jgi:hypothetical protein
LALVGRAIAEIGEADFSVSAIFVGEGDPSAQGDLRPDDAVAAVKGLLMCIEPPLPLE